MERPASVVKELMENSIDAAATRIIVEINNSGFDLIKIIDNGSGIAKEDVELAVEEHATSKIFSINDLFSIKTFGFRGEALSSISAVSKFTLITKQKEDLYGTKLFFENDEKKINEIGCADGTFISVEQLFYNVPARRNFLKAKATEFNHIIDVFINYALIYPNLSFVLIHNQKTIYNLLSAQKWEQRISDVFGKEVEQNIKKLDFEISDFSAKGFLGLPKIARQNRKRQYLFINKRPVSDYLLSKAIKDAYKGLILNNEFPFFIINISVPEGTVDVNVHPRKQEVKFADTNKIYSNVYRVVGDFLDSIQLVNTLNTIEAATGVMQNPKLQIPNPREAPIPNYKEIPNLKFSNFKFQSRNFREGDSFSPNKFATLQTVEIIENENQGFKILGQYNNAYIILEKDSQLIVLDQHAASERMQYEKIKKEWLQKKITVQRLLVPVTIDLNFHEKELLKQNREYLEKIGFGIDDFGESSININSAPLSAVKKDIKKIILELLDEMKDDLELKSYEEKIDKLLKSLACKSAVRFNDALNFEEINALVSNWLKTENNAHCPHGRPSYIEFSMEIFKKMFKR